MLELNVAQASLKLVILLLWPQACIPTSEMNVVFSCCFVLLIPFIVAQTKTLALKR